MIPCLLQCNVLYINAEKSLEPNFKHTVRPRAGCLYPSLVMKFQLQYNLAILLFLLGYKFKSLETNLKLLFSHLYV